MGMDLARHRRGVVAVLRALVAGPMIKLIPHLPTRMEMVVVVEEEEGKGEEDVYCVPTTRACWAV